ncbi:unnamed protein product [Lactuca saligna]|uniref:Protein kinase domain-containing protein n=1 Tax=Lactuca saligna TaxID=75948 RepID=A0AA36EIN7_LACSI|nr:unnamed protein product [Lactuca saligna]
MAIEILILKKLNHPNIIKLEGLVTSNMSYSLYLVFEYMKHDLSSLSVVQGVKFTEPQIFKLRGSPSDEYWKKYRLPNATLFKPQHPYMRCTIETFKDFPPSSLPLLETLLAMVPKDRGTATSALNSKQRGLSSKSHAVDGNRRTRTRERVCRAVPAPEANAEIQSNLDVSFGAAGVSRLFTCSTTDSPGKQRPHRRKQRPRRSLVQHPNFTTTTIIPSLYPPSVEPSIPHTLTHMMKEVHRLAPCSSLVPN